MAGLASVQDLTDIWRPLTTTDDEARLQRLLDKTEALLRQQLPGLDARLGKFALDSLDPYGLDPIAVAQVIASVVKRFLVNPSGASSQTTGPVSVSFVDRYAGKDGSAAIKGTLSITASDLAELRPPLTAAAQIGSFHVAAGLAPRRSMLGYELPPLDAQIADPDSWPVGSDGLPLPGLLRPDTPE